MTTSQTSAGASSGELLAPVDHQSTPDLTGLVDEHRITVEGWSHSRAVLLCSCQVHPLSLREVDTDAGPITTDDVDGLTLRELIDMATSHLTEMAGVTARPEAELTDAHWRAAADAVTRGGSERDRVEAVARAIAAAGRAPAEAWNEGFHAGHEWRESGPTGVPHDPPVNPYRDRGAR